MVKYLFSVSKTCSSHWPMERILRLADGSERKLKLWFVRPFIRGSNVPARIRVRVFTVSRSVDFVLTARYP